MTTETATRYDFDNIKISDYVAHHLFSEGNTTMAENTQPLLKATGKWTAAECKQFEEGCIKFGWGRWKLFVEFVIPSRTSTQIKTHAQKFQAHRPREKDLLLENHALRLQKKQKKIAASVEKVTPKAPRKARAIKEARPSRASRAVNRANRSCKNSAKTPAPLAVVKKDPAVTIISPTNSCDGVAGFGEIPNETVKLPSCAPLQPVTSMMCDYDAFDQLDDRFMVDILSDDDIDHLALDFTDIFEPTFRRVSDLSSADATLEAMNAKYSDGSNDDDDDDENPVLRPRDFGSTFSDISESEEGPFVAHNDNANMVMCKEIRDRLTARADYNKDDEYIVSNDSKMSRTELNPGALMRVRIKRELTLKHYEVAWWKLTSNNALKDNSFEQLVALTRVMLDVKQWRTISAQDTDSAACQIDEEFEILRVGQLLKNAWELVRHSFSRDAFSLLGEDKEERFVAINKMIASLDQKCRESIVSI